MREVSTTALKMRTFTPHQIWTSINTRGQAGCNYDTDRLITQETETLAGKKRKLNENRAASEGKNRLVQPRVG